MQSSSVSVSGSLGGISYLQKVKFFSCHDHRQALLCTGRHCTQCTSEHALPIKPTNFGALIAHLPTITTGAHSYPRSALDPPHALHNQASARPSPTKASRGPGACVSTGALAATSRPCNCPASWTKLRVRFWGARPDWTGAGCRGPLGVQRRSGRAGVRNAEGKAWGGVATGEAGIEKVRSS